MGAMNTVVPLTITDAIVDYVARCEAEGYSPETVKLYGAVLPRFADFAAEKGCITIDQIVLRLGLEWQRYLRQDHRKPDRLNRPGQSGKLSPFTVNLYSRVLRAFASWLVDYGYLDEHPLSGFHPGRLPKNEVVPLSQDEQTHILEAVDSSATLGIRSLAVVSVLLDTGIRASELCRLRMFDVDFSSGAFRINGGKGAKDRTVAIGRRTAAILRRYCHSARPAPPMRKDTDGHLFLNTRSRPLSRFALARLVRKTGEEAGIERLCPHRFRHTFGVNYLKSGGDVLTLQRILGHSTLHMVNHYMHLASSDVVERHRACSPVDNLPETAAFRRIFQRRTRRGAGQLVSVEDGKLVVRLESGRLIEVET